MSSSANPAHTENWPFQRIGPTEIAYTVGFALLTAGLMKLIFFNRYWDLAIITLCLAFTTLIFLVLASRITRNLTSSEGWLLFAQVMAVTVGSLLGTIVAIVVRGRNLWDVLQSDERIWASILTMSFGWGLGGIIVQFFSSRAKRAAGEVTLARVEAERSRAEADACRIEAERAQLEKHVMAAELKLMQAQVEPHFLFNTLANVQHLVESDPPQAARMLATFNRYLRAMLPQFRAEHSTLQQEFEIIRHYLDLTKMRMGKRLSFELELPGELATEPFPPMMLISLIENAVKHGIDASGEPGLVTVRAARNKGTLTVRVIDDGAGLPDTMTESVGLTNIRERLKMMYGDKARLVLADHAPRGTLAAIEIDE